MPGPSAAADGHGAVWTVVVGGGSGSRFGALKQFATLGGRTLLDHSVATASAATDGVVVVLPGDELARWPGAVAGGTTRSDSVRRGLAAVPDTVSIVCVHDAVRPLASAALYAAVVERVRAGADGAVPGLPVTDTIKRVGADGRVAETPDRAGLVAVQTPQAFGAAILRRAHAADGVGTDDATLVEAIGGSIEVVPGEAANIKITHPEDLARVAPGGAPSAVRVGNGLDVHRFSDDPSRPLVLGGCRFDGERGLAGHSDADVVAHAVADAMLGAAVLGDIGQHFPDTEERWRGVDSIALLAATTTLLADAGWSVVNVDCNVMCEAPKLAPRRDEMQQNLSTAVGAPVSVKGRRAEGLGALGRREGIACWAVATIERRAG